MDTNITIPKKEIAPGVFTTGGTATIPSANLRPQAPLNVSNPPTEPTTIEGDIAFYDQLQNQQKTLDQQNLETAKATAETDLTKLLTSFTGQGAEQAQLEQNIVNPIQNQLQDLTGQIGSQIAEYNALRSEFEKMSADIEAGAGRKGLTTGAVMGQQGAVARASQARLNTKASEIALLQAQAQAVQGKLDLAQKQIDRAIDLKYKSIEQEINIKKFQLDNIKESLTAEDKKRADSLNYALNKQAQRVAEQKAEEKSIQNMAMTLGANGVDSATIGQVLKAQTLDEAIGIAGGKLQDPKLRFELEQLKLNNTLTREKIATEQKQRSLMGELTPAEKKAEAQALKQAKTAVPVLQDKITVLDGILGSKALGSTVGTSTLTRPSKNFIGKVNPFGIPNLLGGLLDKTTGERQLLIGSVNQLVSKEFLDSVLSLKAQGGTLGQITEKEGTKLQQSATKIGTWEIRNKKDEVIGYNVSEKEFKKEIERIKEATNRILIEARGNTLNEDEKAVIDSIYGNSLQADPSVYFNR